MWGNLNTGLGPCGKRPRTWPGLQAKHTQAEAGAGPEGREGSGLNEGERKEVLGLKEGGLRTKVPGILEGLKPHPWFERERGGSRLGTRGLESREERRHKPTLDPKEEGGTG